MDKYLSTIANYGFRCECSHCIVKENWYNPILGYVIILVMILYIFWLIRSMDK